MVVTPDGPDHLRFDRWMERCLYHPSHGFYTSGAGAAGRRGDFITSPEVGPLFGAVLARYVDLCWHELGCPDPFVVVDAGTGPGTLTRAMELAAPQCSQVWTLSGVDLASGATTDSVDVEGAVVIANELLDNLPFRVVKRRAHGWDEVFVVNGSETLVPIDDAVGAELDDGPLGGIDDGRRAPLLVEAGRWVRQILDRGAARLLVVDYGAPTTAELADRGGWLRTYRQHERGTDPYIEPGQWDITTDVGFDQLPPPTTLVTQAAALRQWGIADLVEEGRAHWERHAASPDLEALRMRSRVAESAALLDPTGLGSWLVASWH